MTLPEVPPPVRSLPATTAVMVPVPVPGNFWLAAKVTTPLLATERPVGASVFAPEAKSRSSTAAGGRGVVIYRSVCQAKV